MFERTDGLDTFIESLNINTGRYYYCAYANIDTVSYFDYYGLYRISDSTVIGS